MQKSQLWTDIAHWVFFIFVVTPCALLENGTIRRTIKWQKLKQMCHALLGQCEFPCLAELG